jgi:hypothetical protein
MSIMRPSEEMSLLEFEQQALEDELLRQLGGGGPETIREGNGDSEGDDTDDE